MTERVSNPGVSIAREMDRKRNCRITTEPDGTKWAETIPPAPPAPACDFTAEEGPAVPDEEEEPAPPPPRCATCGHDHAHPGDRLDYCYAPDCQCPVFKPPPPEAARCATCGKERGDARHSAGSYDADHAFAPPPAGGEGQVSDEEFERLVTNEPNIFGHDEVSIGRLVAEARRARASEAALAEAIGVVLNEKYLVGKGEWVAVSRPAFDGLKAALGAKEAGK